MLFPTWLRHRWFASLLWSTNSLVELVAHEEATDAKRIYFARSSNVALLGMVAYVVHLQLQCESDPYLRLERV